MTQQYDVCIVGGGIVGLATAWALSQGVPQKRVLVLEKEDRWAKHQSGNNSGVIHSGIYYKPDSYKAEFCRTGNRSMVEFCQQHDIPYEVCGKIIVVAEPRELPLLDDLYQRGLENKLDVTKIGAEDIREREPHVRGLAGIWVPSTGIVDFKSVCQKYAELIAQQGGTLRLNTKVENVISSKNELLVETDRGAFKARFAVNCAGLHSDRLAKRWGVRPEVKIIPFRGEYYELKPEKCHLVRNLIYPVPHPSFPFLGVHFTRTIEGGVHVGPNAVLSFKREGYRKSDFNFRDFVESVSYPGLIRLAVKHAREGMKEVIRSISKKAFVNSVQRLIPDVQSDDLIPSNAGVRAQALAKNGKLVDDFLLLSTSNAVHVFNAPSPAATSSIEIGKAIADQVSKRVES